MIIMCCTPLGEVAPPQVRQVFWADGSGQRLQLSTLSVVWGVHSQIHFAFAFAFDFTFCFGLYFIDFTFCFCFGFGFGFSFSFGFGFPLSLCCLRCIWPLACILTLAFVTDVLVGFPTISRCPSCPSCPQSAEGFLGLRFFAISSDKIVYKTQDRISRSNNCTATIDATDEVGLEPFNSFSQKFPFPLNIKLDGKGQKPWPKSFCACDKNNFSTGYQSVWTISKLPRQCENRPDSVKTVRAVLTPFEQC